MTCPREGGSVACDIPVDTASQIWDRLSKLTAIPAGDHHNPPRPIFHSLGRPRSCFDLMSTGTSLSGSCALAPVASSDARVRLVRARTCKDPLCSTPRVRMGWHHLAAPEAMSTTRRHRVPPPKMTFTPFRGRAHRGGRTWSVWRSGSRGAAGRALFGSRAQRGVHAKRPSLPPGRHAGSSRRRMFQA